MGYSEKDTLNMTMRKFHILYNEYLEYNGLKKESFDLDLL